MGNPEKLLQDNIHDDGYIWIVNYDSKFTEAVAYGASKLGHIFY